MSDPRLWAVNIRGPDDLIAAENYEAAAAVACAFNKWWLENKRKSPLDKFDPLLWAVPILWPYEPAGHADALANPSDEYAGFIKKAAA